MRTPSPDHLEGFFAGLEHARKTAADAKRDKDKAIEREIVALRLCQYAKRAKPIGAAAADVAGAVSFPAIFTSPFWGSWVFHALTGKLMQF